MITSLSFQERLQYSVIRLEAFAGSAPVSSGTGFFFRFHNQENQSKPGIVTNKHVLEGAEWIRFICHGIKDGYPTSDLIDFELGIRDVDIIEHPDPSVDLCAIGVGEPMNSYRREGREIYFDGIPDKLIPKEGEWTDFDAVEDVIMLGYPNGLADESGKFPLVRRGITASPIYRDFNHRSEFMVDMACFPGSSGSPIFTFNRFGRFVRSENRFELGDAQISLVGILCSGPTISQDGEIVLDQRPTVRMASMMHLGLAIRASAILDIDQIVRKRFGDA